MKLLQINFQLQQVYAFMASSFLVVGYLDGKQNMPESQKMVTNAPTSTSRFTTTLNVFFLTETINCLIKHSSLSSSNLKTPGKLFGKLQQLLAWETLGRLLIVYNKPVFDTLFVSTILRYNRL